MLGEDSISIQIKSNLSAQMIASASFFARQTHRIETSHKSGPPGITLKEHRYYSISTILNSVTFLECAINEIYLEAFDSGGRHFAPHNTNLKQSLVAVWAHIDRWATILPKYELALALGRQAPYDHGAPIYQFVNDLIRLRNALVHYKPEWSDNLKNHREIELRLKGRFEESPYSSPDQVFFPERCLGHGCSAWAATTAIAFYRDFRKRLDLPSDKLLDVADLGTLHEE